MNSPWQNGMYLFLLATLASGQVNTGTISGHVVDPNGAAVPQAKVQLLEQQTGLSRSALADESGFYIFPLVSVGVYQIGVEAPGFKTSEHPGIRLEVNQNLTVPVKLELGTVTETVLVQGAPPQVDTVSSSVKEVVDRARIRELPLNGRNVLQLQQLVNGAVFAGSGDQFGNTPAFQVNGGVFFSNNYTLDGGEHSDSFFNSAITFPNPDAIEEFSIQTSSYSAEYGRNRGATVNAVTRSGTNAFHGGLYEFVRNDIFDARDFFAPRKPPFKRNQFGAAIGGPVKRNQAFFFFAWESTRERGAPSTATFQVPSAAMRRGDFSELLPRVIRDPLDNTPFPGNRIPEARLSRPALAFLDKYTPLPNQPGLLFSGPRSTRFNGDQYIGRYDQQFGSKDRVFVRYMRNKDTSLVNRGSFTDWYQDQAFWRQTVTGNHTRTFSPVLINAFTFTFNRVSHLIDIIPHFDWKTLGANIPDTVPNQKGWAQVTLPGYFAASNGVPWDVKRNTYNIADTVTWVKDKHTFKFGTQISRYSTAQLFEFLSAGAIVFSGQFSGDPASDMVLGRMASMRQDSPGKNDLRQTLWGFFFSDDIRLHATFTLNLGLRYEPYFGFHELNGQAAAFRPGRKSTTFPTAPLGLLLQGDEGVHANFFGSDWNNLAPRVGFAWDVFGNQKLAVRGGYGIFYDSVAGIRLNRFVTSQPFLLDLEVQDRPLENPYLGATPFPYFPPSSPEERQRFRFILPANQISANENMVTPYTQQWNLTLERQLAGGVVASAAYVGSKSQKLFGSRNINPAVFGPGATVANTQQRRLYPEFTFIEDTHTLGYSQYHSLQALVKRRFSRGFTLYSAYTLSKNTGYTGSQGEGGRGTRDPFNLRLDNGILNLDATHVWSTSYVWELPAIGESKVGRHVLGGWETTGILQIQSGFPFTVRSGVDNSRNGQSLDTADLAGTPGLTSGSRGQKVARWFNTDAYRINAVGTVGNVGINTLRGPGMWTFDFGAYKNFRIGESYQLQFRSEFFNIFNNVNFGAPVSTVTSGAFGRILSTSTPPRVVELGLKLRF